MSARKRAVRPKAAAGGGTGGSGTGGQAGGGTAHKGTADGGAVKRSRAGGAATGSPARRPAAPPPGSALAQPITLGRLLAYLAALVLGALVGLAGSLVQEAWSPGGMLLALAALGSLCYGAGVATGGRGAGFTAGGGWFLAVIVMSLNRPEGDFVFASGLGPQIFIFGGMLIAVICTTLPRLLAMDDAQSRLPE
ncbi:DUF6113 family protein [Streptomyces sp. WMMC500]|uniref:DUF6113 family protein n=1 Tax=Streptomyces sp. WMMC500 TaxID=3015154 RepID=UPI00248BC990|nr:DUF6113 family protein [Streptomyces sp. WMMC500]WBB63307.1 DUF6113 family protein [Streptomyces sp. WMMC500]